MPWFPDEPTLPESQRASATAWLRYEDVAQDGRLTLVGLPPLTGPAVWGPLLNNHPVLNGAARAGTFAVLTRLVAVGGEGPVSVGKPVSVNGSFQLAHTVDEAGEVNRIVLQSWVHIVAPRGRTHGPPPPGAGEPIAAGHVYGESVFTRLFVPPDQRKVTRFAIEGQPPVPPARHEWIPPRANLDLPEGATPLDAEFLPDDIAFRFGLIHTDANHHVNSLAYPRIFEDAALRRLAQHGFEKPLLGRYFNVAYRKPFFAADRVRVVMRAFVLDGAPGVQGFFLPDGSDPQTAAPHSFIRMHFSE